MKKNKTIIPALLLCIIFITPSCKKWLTVSPRAGATSENQFSSEKGFQDALTGIYLQLKKPELYGAAMSYNAIEHLVSAWDVAIGSNEQYLNQFNYDVAGVQSVFENILKDEYKAIAGINEILSYIDDRKALFTTPGMYEMIKSECLGLRAYCHFDLLRLFGPIPEQATDKPLLQYVTKVSVSPHPYFNFNDYYTLVQQDLKTAAALIENTEPFKKYSYTDLMSSNNGSFDGYRFIRMNYYAIKALQARAFLWTGLSADAWKCATEIISAANANGYPKFPLGNATGYSATDFILTTENMFGLYDFEMPSKYDATFASGLLRKGSSETLITNQLYGNTGTDIRELNLWTLKIGGAQTAYILKKYGSGTAANPFGRYMIPMLRVSEMYLIAVETAPDITTAQQYWNQFRISRNLSPASLPTDKKQLQLMLAKEYQREFYGEGQAFYAYKRINAPGTAMIWPSAGSTVNYVIPIPPSTISQ